MLHRIREVFMDVAHQFEGPAEVDETHMGYRKKHKRGKAKEGIGDGGAAHMTPVAGMKDRKTKRIAVCVLDDTPKASLHDFVESHRKPGAKLYTDEARGYDGLENRESVTHSVASTCVAWRM